MNTRKYVAALVLLLTACSGKSPAPTTGGAGGQPSSTGGGGAGGDGGGGASPMGGGGSTSVTTGPAPDPCVVACDVMSECGFPGICDAANGGIDCRTHPFSDCIYGCFTTAECEEVNDWFRGASAPNINACVGYCDQGTACIDSCLSPAAGADCADELVACDADPECAAWISCFVTCTTPSCFEQCDAQHPTAAVLYDSVYDCFCGACAEVCPLVVGQCP